MIYCDNAATTKVDSSTIDYVTTFANKHFLNPSSLHTESQFIREQIEDVRKQIAQEIHCETEEIIFTSGATEANNFALKGLARAQPEKKHIITSVIEHKSILETCKALAKEGYEIDYIPVDNEGVVLIDVIRRKIRTDTLVVSIMHVNNETGAMQPIEEIGRLCQEKKVYFHSDCVQSFGKFALQVNDLHVTLMSCSGHKVNALKGIGFLYVKLGTRIKPLLDGGGQEFTLRSGTENVLGILSIGKALQKGVQNTAIDAIYNDCIDELKTIPNTIIHSEKGSPYIISISFQKIEGETLMQALAKEGVIVSTGSACSSTHLQENHVLQAMHIDELYIHGTIRISFDMHTTREDIQTVSKTISDCVKILRKKSIV